MKLLFPKNCYNPREIDLLERQSKTETGGRQTDRERERWGRGKRREAKLHHAVRLVFSGIVCSSKIVDFDTFRPGSHCARGLPTSFYFHLINTFFVLLPCLAFFMVFICSHSQ